MGLTNTDEEHKDPATAAWRDDADDRGLEMDLDFEDQHEQIKGPRCFLVDRIVELRQVYCIVVRTCTDSSVEAS